MIAYLMTFAIILTFAITLSILFKKKIEEVIIIGIVEIVAIIFCAGLLDNLRIGVLLVEMLTIIQMIFIIIYIIKKDKQGKTKELIGNICTPGLIIYAILFITSAVINKNRIFENYDEFNHWAVIIKNMFMYNTYGTNPETIVRFNEYPPFTATFQYLFLAIKNVYTEDIVIVAQNILYFSIVIQITKNIKWDKSLKNLLILVPLMIFVPIIFYQDFYLDILVDGILGVMFAYVIYSSFEQEENILFKYTKILVGTIMLCLTKTSGAALAVLAIIIIIIKLLINKNVQELKKNIKAIIIVVVITTLLISMWYIKVAHVEKRWDFKKYIETDNIENEEKYKISENFLISVLSDKTITEREFTVFSVMLIYICIQLYAAKKVNNKEYSYYAWAMIISIPIYLISLLVTYVTIFDLVEAQHLTCFDRYTSTILIAYPMFLSFTLTGISVEKDYKKRCFLVITIILALLPISNIEEKYIKGKNYVLTSNINRNIYTKLKQYKESLKPNDKILLIVGPKTDIEYITAMNEYEIMPIKITATMVGVFGTQENFETIIKDYDYVFIYRIKQEQKETIKKVFLYENISNDTLYKVFNEDGKVILKQKML